MDFRENQDRAKKNSLIIWALYILLLLISSSLIAYALLVGMNLVELSDAGYSQYAFSEHFKVANKMIFATTQTGEYRQLMSFLSLMSLALIVMAAVTAVGFMQKSSGHKVAQAFGGKLITEDNELSLAEKQLLNIVNEQALAATIATPALYVIPDDAINAFAAGKTTEDAIVAITQGAIDNLNRTQLSGIVAHEIGHIVNHDIKLNIRISAFVFGFTALFFLARMIFYQAIYNRRMDGRAKMIMIAVAVVIAIIGVLTVWFGRMLQAAMSRQREYLADASAVQFTRYPEGLVEAFEVLKAGGKKQATMKNPNAKEYAHALMFGMSGQLFATHPPLDKRIERIKGNK